MNAETCNFEAEVTEFRQDIQRLEHTLRNTITGQDKLISSLLIAIISGGHVLIESVPGLGKTHLVKALAAALGLPLARIQCTPDLMPADITGSELLIANNLEFRHGPIFSSLVLVDEINRATPKTQAALLEAMQEGQITYAGHCYPLPKPFWVIATQNPIELEGTYPLPEAQLDRFLFKLDIEFPSAEALTRMVDLSLDSEPSESVKPVLSSERIVTMQALSQQVVISQRIKEAAVALLLATHPTTNNAQILYGASPRGLQALLKAARIHALIHGRAHLAIEDLESIALAALRHRILPTLETQMSDTTVDELLNEIIATWRTKFN